MHRFSRMHLSPEAALRSVEHLDLEEKSRLADGLAVLAVIDHRRDYLAAGYSCTLDSCMQRLHMSQDRSLKRIQVARVGLQLPELFELLADGRLSVTTAAVLAPHLTPETAPDLLAAAAFLSRQEVLRLLADRSRVAASPSAPESTATVQEESGSYAPGHMNSLADLCAPTADAAPSPAPAPVDNARRGRVYASATGGHEVRLSLTDEEHDHLRRATALLGHAVPSGDPALVYARAMQHYLAHLEKRRFGAKRQPAAPAGEGTATSLAPEQVRSPRAGRAIPNAFRRLVWERDGGCCAFVGTDGHRCGSTTRLEVDHITPVALGGRTEPANLRLLCRAHNQFEAERVLGKDRVRRRRESARRERARDRAAAEAGAARAETRERGAADSGEAQAEAPNDAQSTRHDDIVAALRGLGFTLPEAKHGAGLAKAMPDASLENCLRHALTELTRPVFARGERLARCSA